MRTSNFLKNFITKARVIVRVIVVYYKNKVDLFLYNTTITRTITRHAPHIFNVFYYIKLMLRAMGQVIVPHIAMSAQRAIYCATARYFLEPNAHVP